MSKKRITININYPEDLDLDNNEMVDEYLSSLAVDVARQVYAHLKDNNKEQKIKEQRKFLDNFFNNPRWIEGVLNGKRK